MLIRLAGGVPGDWSHEGPTRTKGQEMVELPTNCQTAVTLARRRQSPQCAPFAAFEGTLEFLDAPGELLVLLARQGRHVTDHLEFLAAHEVHARQQQFGMLASALPHLGPGTPGDAEAAPDRTRAMSSRILLSVCMADLQATV